MSPKLKDYILSRKFEDYIYTLMNSEYADIKHRTVKVEWGGSGPNAVVISSHDKTDIIRFNRSILDWPEPASCGLLFHELSHIALGANIHSEHQADRDVIERGLGPYLAIERLLTNKIDDHIVREGEDRYLGYESIRNLLSSVEIYQLDKMLLEHEM
jgi:hypothetical protein